MEMNDMIIVSVDDHVVEPPHMFDAHLSEQHKGIRPALVRTEDGRDVWQFGDDAQVGNIGLNAVVGRVKEEYGCEPVSYDQMRRNSWDLNGRIDDMNVNGIAACLNFPTIAGLDGNLFLQIKDRKDALTLLRAYNDWHMDDLVAGHPGRAIPMMVTPMWDVNEIVAEIKRNSAKGCHAITFSDNPTMRGLPSIHDAHWEPLWKACVDYEMIINIHIGSGAQAQYASALSPIEAWITTMPISIVNSAADWLNLQALHRYPDLKIFLSEGSIGWIPYFLERADFTNEQHKAWTYSDFGGGKPSELFWKHFYTCFIEDRFGIRNIDEMNEDHICYECDYPHSDTLWPESPEYLWDSVKNLSETRINKITHGNALKAFQFDLFGKMGGRENCTVGALRAKATHVSTERLSLSGARPERGAQGPVTSEETLRVLGASVSNFKDEHVA
jgi:predicted TIM-barrel fold metal-dependent hydrolase